MRSRPRDSPWPVSALSHPRLRGTPDQSPEKTAQSWARPAGGRDPAARGTCPYSGNGDVRSSGSILTGVES